MAQTPDQERARLWAEWGIQDRAVAAWRHAIAANGVQDSRREWRYNLLIIALGRIKAIHLRLRALDANDLDLDKPLSSRSTEFELERDYEALERELCRLDTLIARPPVRLLGYLPDWQAQRARAFDRLTAVCAALRRDYPRSRYVKLSSPFPAPAESASARHVSQSPSGSPPSTTSKGGP